MLHGFYKNFGKRLLDILLSGVIFVLLCPLLAVIALLVKIDSKGPALFIQERLGRHGKIFKMFKFRTMIVNAEQQGTKAYSFANDPRITKLGKILRKLSLDELPQLLNILKGDMAFVGPRPILTYHPCKYEEYTSQEKQVFTVRPGITGWAQINGRNTVDWVERFQLNQWYVAHVSLGLDVRIVLQTIIQVFSAKQTVIETETAKQFKQQRERL